MSDSKKTPTKITNIDTANHRASNSRQPSNTLRLTNSLRLKAPNQAKRRQNMASILQRLPFLRQLNDAQNSLLKINPTWLRWCKQHSSLTLTLSEHASLTSLDQGVLCIACENASAASLVKHSQSSLLDACRSAGFEHISRIKVQMALNKAPDDDTTNRNRERDEPQVIERPKPSASALKSIEATQSLIENEQLAASLKRLAKTLKQED